MTERFSDPAQTRIGFAITFSLLSVSFVTATFNTASVNQRLHRLEQHVGIAAESSGVAAVRSSS